MELLVSSAQVDFGLLRSAPKKHITDPQVEAMEKPASSQLRVGVCHSIPPNTFSVCIQQIFPARKTYIFQLRLFHEHACQHKMKETVRVLVLLLCPLSME